MPSAEILTIGTELLLGEILDSNAQYLAQQLRDAGIDHYWTTTVGDNEGRIAEAVQLALSRSDIVLCTGGLGPTVDDVTREGIGAALGLELEFSEDLWQGIVKRFARFKRTPSENNKRQAYLPAGGQPLNNSVGSAPGIIIEYEGKLVFAMPGVPREMIAMWAEGVLPILRERFGAGVAIRTRVLHTAAVPESLIDERIADLERGQNPTVGLAAHGGSVDVRLTAKADSTEEALAMLDALEIEVRGRLEDWVYGMDGDTLPGVIAELLRARGWKLAIAERGLGGILSQGFGEYSDIFQGGHEFEGAPKSLLELAEELIGRTGVDASLAAELKASTPQSELRLAVVLPGKQQDYAFTYGGAPDIAPRWALNACLNVLRKLLLKS
jgi:nicotinamide-nucleotide amidase